MRSAAAIVPGCRAEPARPGRRSRRPRDGATSTPAPIRLWKTLLRDGTADPDFAARRRRRRSAASTPLRPRPRACRRRVSDRRHLPRHPARALSARHRRAPSGPRRRACAALAATHARDQARAGARRRQPEEHPGRPATGRCCWTPSAPGTATRPSISPSASTTCCSSACGRRRRRGASSPASTRWPRPTSRGVDWEPRDGARGARRRACCPACCSRGSTASRRSNT